MIWVREGEEEEEEERIEVHIVSIIVTDEKSKIIVGLRVIQIFKFMIRSFVPYTFSMPRDGVSESQFNQVLNIELDQIIEATSYLNIKSFAGSDILNCGGHYKGKRNMRRFERCSTSRMISPQRKKRRFCKENTWAFE
ncbi:hypothetical protein LguiB_028071 [Lonicera macranthoides]